MKKILFLLPSLLLTFRRDLKKKKMSPGIMVCAISFHLDFGLVSLILLSQCREPLLLQGH